MSDVALITKGEKVGGSEATLLAKLGIKPFSYGLVVQQARRPAARSLNPLDMGYFCRIALSLSCRGRGHEEHGAGAMRACSAPWARSAEDARFGCVALC